MTADSSRDLAGSLARIWRRGRIGAVLLATSALLPGATISARLVAATRSDGAEWPVYGGNAAGHRYSALRQITPANVGGLVEAWRVETGKGGLQTSPIMIGGVLYATAPDQSVMALDAATGRVLWRFSPGKRGYEPVRGLTWWSDGGQRRLFASATTFLYALDPATGKPVESFGAGGRIDLREGLGRDPAKLAVFMTTPGIVFGDVIITGFRTGETAPAAPGAIRAYDVRTGALRWIFKVIPDSADPGSTTWPANAQQTGGGANNWAGFALDEKRGIVYAPTGSPVTDFYGADRTGDNLYANSLVALDAATGRRLWHFQAVHHDIWDRDLPSPPSLATVRRGGQSIDVVVQPSKQGFLYILDRVTGRPVFPIAEQPFSASDVPGEVAATTQPVPALPLPLARQVLREDMLTRRTPEAHAAALKRFREVISAGPYKPFSADRKTIMFPGFDGGAEWGGGAIDPRRGIYYINAQDVPWLGGLKRNAMTAGASVGATLYAGQCAACHGPERNGSPPEIPSLVGAGARLTRAQIDAVLVQGRGRMPAFPQLTAVERAALMDILLEPAATSQAASAEPVVQHGVTVDPATPPAAMKAAYAFTGYEKFRDPDGYPAVVPPWGTLNAIDLNSGAYLWKVPLGEYPELAAAGVPATGTENYGGPLLTRSGLLFIGATIYDRKLRAFDARSGRVLWQTVLPYAGTATPITYAIRGRQYVVIATSGQRNTKGPQGSAYVAYALAPRR